ncbi:hypothetical protein KK083_20815 [Fulvivirgaceae bacterium PWU4]|uniref:Uncharacterized protein n=1 Tax=Chryseosolibacter histidini TaxID=2782349 RepID=A0AAP2GKI4_9BACT|nr:hypothetical protein [Chryseosolibacter histidini]MBT1699351.1 hypothetical protein [Chryseosolibacter histidini]
MTPALWIGFAFLALLLLVLIAFLFIPDKLSSTQKDILHFFMSICAGFAGGFITGDVLFQLDAKLSDGFKFGISGTAGVALFLVVFFKKKVSAVRHDIDGFNFSIPQGWTFEQAVAKICEVDRSLYHIDGFTDAELSSKLKTRELHTRNALEALKRLKYFADRLPSYKVTLTDDIYTIQKI